MQRLQVKRTSSVAHLRLNRSEKLNAIDQIMLSELSEAFETFAADRAVKAIVLSGAGKAFSAGFDVAWMAGLPLETVVAEVNGVCAIYDGIAACTKPVIAAINGPALGGGLLLALTADLRVAAAGASFGVPEVKIGIFPNLGFLPRLTRIVGEGSAKQLVYLGEPVSAAEAHRLGLVQQLVQELDAVPAAMALAERLASLPAPALRAAKAAFAAVGQGDFPAVESSLFAECWASPEREAAMRRFTSRERNEETND